MESTSTASTSAPASASARVSEPRPAPISTTRSPGPTSASDGDRTSEVRVDQEVLTERPLRSDAVAFGESAKRARAERRLVAGTHWGSLAGPETVRSRAEGPGSNVKGGSGWCADAVSVGQIPMAERSSPTGSAVVEPSRTFPERENPHGRGRGCPDATGGNRGLGGEGRALPTDPLRSVHHPVPHIVETAVRGRRHTPDPRVPAEPSSERRASAVPFCSE